MVNTYKPRQNGGRFADNTFKRIFMNENVRIPIKISLKFVPNGPINNNSSLVQIMAWRLSGDKPLSEPMIGYWCIYTSLGLNELTKPRSPWTSSRMTLNLKREKIGFQLCCAVSGKLAPVPDKEPQWLHLQQAR